MSPVYAVTDMFYGHRSGTYDFSSCDPKMRQEKRKLIQNWSSHKIKALRFYKEFLSESIGAWKNFSDTDRAYFDGIKDTLALSFKAIDKAFKRLSRLLQKVKEMIKELQQDYPLGVSQNPFDIIYRLEKLVTDNISSMLN